MGVVVVYSECAVLLWSKALVLDLDQAEQLGNGKVSCNFNDMLANSV